jgi:thioesterase domain-containing protein
VSAKTVTEKTLVEIWQDVLEIDKIGVKDNYFYLGGDSILAAIILNKISVKLGLPTIPLVIFLHAPTVRKMSTLIDERQLSFPPASLVAIEEKGTKPPLFLVHACSGEVIFYQKISQYLREHPVYAFRSRNLESNNPDFLSVEEIAEQYVQEMMAFQTEGPYMLGGAGIGGIIAYEMALQILNKKNQVDLLILFDTQVPASSPQNLRSRYNYYFHRMFLYLKQKKIFEIIKGFFGLIEPQYRKIAAFFDPRVRVWILNEEAVNKYILKPYTGKTLLFVTDENVGLSEKDHRIKIEKWRYHLKGQFKIELIPGRHLEIFNAPNVEVLAEKLKPHLFQAYSQYE